MHKYNYLELTPVFKKKWTGQTKEKGKPTPLNCIRTLCIYIASTYINTNGQKDLF